MRRGGRVRAFFPGRGGGVGTLFPGRRVGGRGRCEVLLRRGGGYPLLGEFLLHEHDSEDDVQDDQAKRHVKDAVITRSRIDDAAQHGRDQDGHRHAQTDKAHGLADCLVAYRVGQEGETDGPDNGRGDALQHAADDEKGEGGAETEEEGRAEEGEQSNHEREASGRRVVREIPTYGCPDSV